MTKTATRYKGYNHPEQATPSRIQKTDPNIQYENESLSRNQDL